VDGDVGLAGAAGHDDPSLAACAPRNYLVTDADAAKVETASHRRYVFADISVLCVLPSASKRTATLCGWLGKAFLLVLALCDLWCSR